jgi:Fe-S cluster assembly iron-binding protein IscA
MITITDNAADRLLELLRRSDASPGETFRLSLDSDGLTLKIAIPRQTDRLMEKEGRTVLAVDSRTDSVVGEATIKTNGNGKELRLARAEHNPEGYSL